MSEREARIQNIRDQKSAILRDSKRIKAELSQRTPTADFLRRVNEVNEIYGFQLVNTGRSGFYKEAYLAARFAPRRGASHVWLHENDPPDFWIEVDGDPLSFEATEILRPGRYRDHELQKIMETERVQHDPEENWLSVEENVALINKAISVKSADRYKHVHGLFLYLNTGIVDHVGSVLDGVEAVVSLARKKCIATHYREVWIVCSEACERIR